VRISASTQLDLARSPLALALALALAGACDEHRSELSSPPSAANALSAANTPPPTALRAGASEPVKPGSSEDGEVVNERHGGRRLSGVLFSSLGSRFPFEADLPPAALGKARPAALIAPSRSWGLDDRRALELAQRLLERGAIVMRVGWALTSQRPAPSSTEPGALAYEQAELERALAQLSQHPRVDPRRVVIIGRDVGAVAGYAVFRKIAAARALVLIGPPCIDGAGFELRYPALAREQRPVLLVGVDNPVSCPDAVLQKALQGAPPNVEREKVAPDELNAAIDAFWQRLERP